eukprot:scaffold119535_cov17-Tisochrysis_lutea.AAC.2
MRPTCDLARAARMNASKEGRWISRWWEAKKSEHVLMRQKKRRKRLHMPLLAPCSKGKTLNFTNECPRFDLNLGPPVLAAHCTTQECAGTSRRVPGKCMQALAGPWLEGRS